MPTDTTIIDRLLRMFKQSATPECVDVPQVIKRADAAIVELLDALTAAYAARDAAERTSDGRLRALLLKGEEARSEWTRAENAIADADALREQLARRTVQLATALRERDEARAAQKAPDA